MAAEARPGLAAENILAALDQAGFAVGPKTRSRANRNENKGYR
jgi:hypothetical protein